MTTVSLTTELREAIEDEDSVKFPTDAKLYTILSTAQLEAAALLENNYLTEFEIYAENVAMPATGIAMGVISSNITVLKGTNGIIAVNCIFTSSEKHAEFVDVRNINLLDSDDFGGDDGAPRWYVRAGVLYLKITAATFPITVDVTFLREPPDLTAIVNPLLGDAYRSILLDLAAARCWKQREKTTREASARKTAIDGIKILNDKIDF